MIGGHQPTSNNNYVSGAGLAISRDGSLLVSISEDRSVKVFDVASLDLMTMLRLPFVPSCAEWIYKACLSPALIYLFHNLSTTPQRSNRR